ncbi:uncharacterized protein LOC144868986 isoform X4 [Branchiostoma floridae x Branchiostoma japonicum]
MAIGRAAALSTLLIFAAVLSTEGCGVAVNKNQEASSREIHRVRREAPETIVDDVKAVNEDLPHEARKLLWHSEDINDRDGNKKSRTKRDLSWPSSSLGTWSDLLSGLTAEAEAEPTAGDVLSQVQAEAEPSLDDLLSQAQAQVQAEPSIDEFLEQSQSQSQGQSQSEFQGISQDIQIVNGTIVYCQQDCENGGVCTGLNVCRCAPGWTGTYCTDHMCTQTCVHGSCSGPNTCLCDEGYQGETCEQAICNPVCANGGVCTAPNECQCEEGYEGDQCQTAICHSTCENGGYCSRPDFCTCQIGYAGQQCETPVCDPSCLHGGACSAPDTCTCQAGWEGPICQTPICTLECQNGGVCTEPGRCSCPSSFGGPQCQYDLYQDDGITQVQTTPAPDHSGRFCGAFGHQHYFTFDGHFYTFPGTCQYLLSGDCLQATFQVFVRYDPNCTTSSLLCHREVRVHMMGLSHDLILHQGHNYEVTKGDVTLSLPNSEEGVKVEKVGDYVRVILMPEFDGKLVRVAVYWDGVTSVYVEVDEDFAGNLCGLCGNFNGNSSDEYRLRDGTASSSRITFANSWKMTDAEEHCPNVHVNTPNSCASATQQQLQEIWGICNVLIGNAAFAPCHAVVDPNPYLDACVTDLCNCDYAVRGDCQCEALTQYSRACAHRRIVLDWRQPELCYRGCPATMVYTECASSCPRTCRNPTGDHDCDDHCVDGCSCPEGSLWDEGSLQCVVEQECPCTHLGMEYAPGSNYLDDCNKYYCLAGRWIGTNLECNATCSIHGDPHITTFDKRYYQFAGVCQYIVAKDFVNQQFTLLADQQPCGDDDSSSCIRSVTLIVGGNTAGKIKLHQHGVLSVGHSDVHLQLPYHNDDVSVRRLSSVFVEVTTSFGLTLQWDGRGRLYTTVTPALKGHTKGLCGTFNDKQNDDFTTRSGVIVANVAEFGNSWKVSADCEDQPVVTSDLQLGPCAINTQRAEYARQHCGLMSGGSFEACNRLLEPATYITACEYDVCQCQDGDECLCSAIAHYARECAKLGAVVNWRTEGTCVEECPQVGQVWQECSSACRSSCRYLSEPDSGCTEDCVAGCNCPPGLYQSESGACVPQEECQCFYQGEVYQTQTSTVLGNLICFCEDGIMNCQERVIMSSEYNCTSGMEYFDCEGAAAGQMGKACEETCGNIGMECLAEQCVSGCQCPHGLVRDGSECVLPEECRCEHNGQMYDPGQTISVDCNSCTCSQGVWSCTTKECAAQCSMFGNSHYTTFDGHSYEFEGTCKYIIAQDYCYNQTGSFRIHAEKTACNGLSGNVCARTVTVTLQQLQIHLEHGKDVHVGPIPGSEVAYTSYKFNIYRSGFFTIIKVENGIDLYWDNATRLYIKVWPNHRGRVCGMCGNFDGNQINDFNTPELDRATTVQDFANSWKVSSSCPDVEAPLSDYCALHPHREAWARRQCNIILSDTFSPCHYKVDPEPYYQACVQDSCSCDSGGDCECFCTAVAAYGDMCNTQDVHIRWRTHELCPTQCEDYNWDPEKCEWHYDPCGTSCPATCEDPHPSSCDLQCMEGCHPKCPNGTVLYNGKCIPPMDCPVTTTTPLPTTTAFIPTTVSTTLLPTTTESIATTTLEVTTASETTPMPTTTRGEGGGKTTTAAPTTEVTPTGSPSPPVQTTTEATTIQSTTTFSTTTPEVTTPCEHAEVCYWTSWINSDLPRVQRTADNETLAHLLQAGSNICMHPSMIECRTSSHNPDNMRLIPVEQVDQEVTCDVDQGFLCLAELQENPFCLDYEVRLYCCSCGGTVPPITTTSQPTTTESTTSTVSTTTQSTTTESTTISTTQPTTTETTTTIVSTTPCEHVQEMCEWKEWMNKEYPNPNSPSQNETYANLRDTYDFCDTPMDIQCSISGMPMNTPFESMAQQGVICDINSGLYCDASQIPGFFGVCYDYEIRVKCCWEECVTPTSTEYPPTTTESTTVSTTTEPTTTESTTSTVSTTTQPTTTESIVTTTPCEHVEEMCEWSDWMNKDEPSDGNPNQNETYDNLRDIYEFCEEPMDIECSVAGMEGTQMSLPEGVSCDQATGLVCYASQLPGKGQVCEDYQIRVKCCSEKCVTPVPTTTRPTTTPTTTVSTTTQPTTTETTTVSTTQPTTTETTTVSTTTQPTTTETTSSTTVMTPTGSPSPTQPPTTESTTVSTTSQPTTTESTTVSTTSQPTTTESTTSTVSTTTQSTTTESTTISTTQPTTTETTTTIVSTTPCEHVQEMCQWSDWMNKEYPNPNSPSQNETYANLRDTYDFCDTPMDIQCGISGIPMNTPFESIAQEGVMCDINSGLYCDASQISGFFGVCYDYEIRVKCCWEECVTPTPTRPTTTESTTVSTEYQPTTTESTTVSTTTEPTTTESTTVSTEYQPTTTESTTVSTTTEPTTTESTTVSTEYQPTTTESTTVATTTKPTTTESTTVSTEYQPTTTESTTVATTTKPTTTESTTVSTEYQPTTTESTTVTVATTTKPTTTESTTVSTEYQPTTTESTTVATTTKPTTTESTTVSTEYQPTTTESTTVATTTKTTESTTVSTEYQPTTTESTTVSTTTKPTTTESTTVSTTIITTTPCEHVEEMCEWSDWMNKDEPSGGNPNQNETYDNLRDTYEFCEAPMDIECSVAGMEGTQMSLPEGVSCDQATGLVCYASQLPGKGQVCEDYQIRVKCCSEKCVTPVPTTTQPTTTPTITVSTTTQPTTTETTTVSTTAQPTTTETTSSTTVMTPTGSPSPTQPPTTESTTVSTTSQPTTTESTTSTVSTTTQPTTTESTTVSTGYQPTTTESTTVSTTTQPTTTESTTVSTTIITTTPCEHVEEMCEWSDWMNKDEPSGGNPNQNETYDNLRDTYEFCEEPMGIECSVAGMEGTQMSLPEGVSCDQATGLVCYASQLPGKGQVCEDYQIRVKCCSEKCVTPVPTTTRSTTTPTTTVSTTTQPTTTETTTVFTTQPTTTESTTVSTEYQPTTSESTTVSTTTKPTTTESTTVSTTIITTTPCEHVEEMCEWSDWMNKDEPSGGNPNQNETYDNLRDTYEFCEAPMDIECSVAGMEGTQMSLPEGVSCDQATGLVCYASQLPGKGQVCEDYQIRVKCCSEKCVTPVPTTTRPTTTPTTTVSTTTQPTTTETTTVSATTVPTTTETTIVSTTTQPTTTETTSSSTTVMTPTGSPSPTQPPTTESTTVSTTVQSTTPTSCGYVCNWTDWMNSYNPSTDMQLNDVETLENLHSRFSFCETPMGIECRYAENPSLDFIDHHQPGVTCEVDSGLYCDASLTNVGACMDYEVRFQCCHVPDTCKTTTTVTTEVPTTTTTVTTERPLTTITTESTTVSTTTQPTTTESTTVSTTALPTTTAFLPPSTTECPDVCIDGSGLTRQVGDTWFEAGDQCQRALYLCRPCGVISINRKVCDVVEPPSCANGLQPIDVGVCCPEYQCPCECKGYGDPHYFSFDGEYFYFQGEGEFILARDTHVPHDFEVRGFNVQCTVAPITTCTKEIKVIYKGHTIELKTGHQVLVNGTSWTPPFKLDGCKVTTMGFPLKLEIQSLDVTVVYDFLSSGFYISVPPTMYAGKTEGLCGPCNNNKTDDCQDREGTIMNDYNNCSCDWKVDNPDSPSNSCIPEPKPTATPSTPCDQSPCDIITDPEGPFGACHDVVDYEFFLQSCQYDRGACYSECQALGAYAYVCQRMGVCVDWRGKGNNCSFECEAGLVYKACSCVKTCENMDVFNASQCALAYMETEGCFCPDDMVLHETSEQCIEGDTCNGCEDANGMPLAIGDTWIPYNDSCQECTCTGHKKTECYPRACPTYRPPKCGVCESQRVVEGSDSCCPEYECVCDLNRADCPEVVIPQCEYQYQYVHHTNPGECVPEYECRCNSSKCPAAPQCEPPKVLDMLEGECCLEYECVCDACPTAPTPYCPPGEGYVLVSSEDICSCVTHSCECRNDTCAQQPECDDNKDLVTTETGCCPHYNCTCNTCPTHGPVINCDYAEGYVLVSSQDDCGCVTESCECREDSCSPEPECPDNKHVVTVETGCCPHYNCSCNSCPPSPTPGSDCPYGEMPGYVIHETVDDCGCVNSSCTCDRSRCPAPPTCDDNKNLVALYTPCCQNYTCECKECPVDDTSCGIGETQTTIIDDCCRHTNCTPEPVCVYQNTTHQPGTSWTDANDNCIQCQCLEEIDPATGFHRVSCSDESSQCEVNCPACHTYQERSGECCGECVKTSCCVMDDDETLVEHPAGSNWTSPGDSCSRCHCLEAGEHGQVVEYCSTLLCPEPPTCSSDEVMKNTSSADGCCTIYECVPPGQASCSLFTKQDYLRVDDCVSLQPVNVTWCEGRCGSSSMYEGVDLKHTCECCHEVSMSEVSVPMECEGTTTSSMSYAYRQITACDCDTTECEVPTAQP